MSSREPEVIRGHQRRRGNQLKLILDRPMHLRPGDQWDQIISGGGRVIGVAIYRASFWRRLWTRVKGVGGS